MGNMVACSPVQRSADRTNHHLQKFVKDRHHTSTSSPHHTLTINERIVVSRQDRTAWAVAMGSVTKATENEVELLIDK